jgi:hypothetical protein
MFTRLFKALLGAFGVIKKDLKFDTSHNSEFLQSLEAGTIVLTHSKGFLQDGIQGATDSAWCHSLLYVGKTAGAMVRQMFPDLLTNKKIPKDSQFNEIVEAQGGGVQVDNLQKDLGNDIQLVAYTRKLTTVELMKVLYRIYSNVGKPYGYLDFLTELFPNPSDVMFADGKGFICSALTTDAYEPVEIVAPKGVNPHKVTPGQQNEYLEPNLNWTRVRYNW